MLGQSLTSNTARGCYKWHDTVLKGQQRLVRCDTFLLWGTEVRNELWQSLAPLFIDHVIHARHSWCCSVVLWVLPRLWEKRATGLQTQRGVTLHLLSKVGDIVTIVAIVIKLAFYWTPDDGLQQSFFIVRALPTFAMKVGSGPRSDGVSGHSCIAKHFLKNRVVDCIH